MPVAPGAQRSIDPRSRLVLVVGACGAVVLVALFASPGSPSVLSASATVLLLWIESGWAPVAWMIAAAGIGISLSRRLGCPSALALPLGVAVLLWVAHALGAIGGFSGRFGPLVAWAPVAFGVALAAVHAIRSPLRFGFSPLLLSAVPAAAILVVAACVPPGTLWRSEAHGYDTLSYHLQLPREWLALGRIAPLEHNVYSFLPSYVEAAYTHLGAMLGGADTFVSGSARPVYAGQMLHALLVLAGAATIAAGARRLMTDDRLGEPVVAGVAALCAACALAVPWVIVVGSSAYNEAAVILLFAGAMIVAFDRGASPLLKGVTTGFLIGVATGAKPTAFFMTGIPVGIALAFFTPFRRLPLVLLFGAAAGLLALAPWLIRNWVASGNPVFPYATALFGSAHWSTLEVDRWRTGHHESTPLSGRLALLFSVHRGLLHPQWSIFPPVVVAAGISALIVARREARRLTLILILVLAAQLTCWIVLGHQQSRFLVPIVVPGAMILALALGTLARAPLAAFVLGVATTIALSLAGARVYLSENGGRPATALVPGVGALTGELAESQMSTLGPDQHADLVDALPPVAFINLALAGAGPASSVFLLGDATPLYFRVPVVYHTTWDPSPLGPAAGRHPGDIGAAVDALCSMGITHVLINLDEITRLTRDGWYDPRVTPEFAADLAREGGTLVRSWAAEGRLGSFLIALPQRTDTVGEDTDPR